MKNFSLQFWWPVKVCAQVHTKAKHFEWDEDSEKLP